MLESPDSDNPAELIRYAVRTGILELMVGCSGWWLVMWLDYARDVEIASTSLRKRNAMSLNQFTRTYSHDESSFTKEISTGGR